MSRPSSRALGRLFLNLMPGRSVRRAAARLGLVPVLLLALATLVACGGDEAESGSGGPPSSGGAAGGRGGGSGGRPGGPGGFGGPPAETGVPVEVETASRAPISLYFETNGTLEAERDVNLVARAAGPIMVLEAEEGQRVSKGQRLASIDDAEIRSQLAVSKIQLDEAKALRNRMTSLWEEQLVSREEYDRAVAGYETALGNVQQAEIQLQYTNIDAPFSGQIARRHVRLAEFVNIGTSLFRITNFDALLCRIQVPERELQRLRPGQPALIEVEAFPGTRFEAEVLRISPVIEADSGTVRVTLEVPSQGKLRPGMFTRVYLELERRQDALVVAKHALALDSLGDAVYVVNGKVARRRSITLGFESADRLEIVEGLEAGEQVVVVGQDGLSEGTPVEVLRRDGERLASSAPPAGGPGAGGPGAGGPGAGGPGAGGPGAGGPAAGGPETGGSETGAAAAGGPRGRPGGPGGFRIDFDDPAAVERAKSFMRQRGLSDEQIEARLKRMRERQEGAADDSGRQDG